MISQFRRRNSYISMLRERSLIYKFIHFSLQCQEAGLGLQKLLCISYLTHSSILSNFYIILSLNLLSLNYHSLNHSHCFPFSCPRLLSTCLFLFSYPSLLYVSFFSFQNFLKTSSFSLSRLSSHNLFIFSSSLSPKFVNQLLTLSHSPIKWFKLSPPFLQNTHLLFSSSNQYLLSSSKFPHLNFASNLIPSPFFFLAIWEEQLNKLDSAGQFYS